MSAPETPTAPRIPALSLRERKKLRTRQDIRRAAYRLFTEQGYEATTVDRISDAAEVSPSTFFRYFPTKEDVVLSDEYDPMLAEALRARPADEPIVDAIRHALTDSFGRLLAADRDDLLLRTRLVLTDPVLRARSMDDQLRSQDAISALIVERTGRAPDDLEVHCASAAIIAVFTAVVRHWVQRDGTEDLAALYDRNLTLLAQGLRF
ncbi:TetR family transcriptional regulator [Streptomyces sp. NPDC092296]|uniref:acyl-CoA-like ligand-binding transcription factor n=1 Tax=Streptomyces sp. NPDC092296 TaxID=3366012 RepID=UPI0038016D26